MDPIALRLAPEFDYPVYGGHKADSKRTLDHILVLIIRLTLLHDISKLSPGNRFTLYVILTTAEHAFVNAPDATRRGRTVRLVADKVLAAPGRLSRDEYWELPKYVALAGMVSSNAPFALGWGMILSMQGELEQSQLLRGWDCDRAE